MKIAIITGASSGLGKEFTRQISFLYHKLDEIWIIARSSDKLEAVSRQASGKIRPMPLDLCSDDDRESLRTALKENNAKVKILVNAAGVGKIGQFTQLPWSPQQEMIRLDAEALTAVTYLCLPFMRRGSRIIQMASAAAFLPQPGFAVYAAVKAYVLSFSRALGAEVRDRGITVTSVCPGPVDTPFFDKAEEISHMSAYKKKYMVQPGEVAAKAVRDAASGRELSVYGVPMKALAIAAKLLPVRTLVMGSQYLDRLHMGTERK